MATWRANALVAAAWALCGCNVLIGLDDVNIDQSSSGGATGTTAPSGGGGATGAASQGGGATTEPPGGDGAGGAPGETTPPTGGAGGEAPTSSTGGGETSSTGGGGSTSSAGGGGTGGATSSSSSSSGTGGATSSSSGTGGAPGGPCGNGFIDDAEQCDDGNSNGGDGCSAACQVEPFHQCTVPGPSACSEQEVLCADGDDNDGDAQTDFSDTDCTIPVYAPSVPCQVLRMYWSVNAPLAIPDNGAGKAVSPIFVPEEFAVDHTAVLLGISHGRVSDIEATLVPPFGPPRNLTSHNGGNGSNYDGTLLDTACAASVTAGSAPFQGCYKPESSLPGSGQQAKGIWSLEVSDSGAGQTGTLDGWALILCAP